MTIAAYTVTDPIAEHGEGPVWSSRWGGLRWVDMLAGDVLALDAGGGVRRRHAGSLAAVVRPRVSGGYVVAAERELLLSGSDDLDAPLRSLGEAWTDPSVRMNEGGCDPDGRFYIGSMAYDAAPGRGSFYVAGPGGELSVVLPGVTISNGFDFSPDGSLAYYADTATGRVDVLDYTPDGGLSGRRPFAVVDPGQGAPDGLTVDAEGGVWVALWQGGAVHRYDAGGRLDAVITLPVRKVTAVAFGGAGLDRLFITTSALDVDRAEQPAAGALFAADPGVRGRPVLSAAL
ncbi:SMP-30/gluconolactonase/LRE family protein [Nonomuraea sp. KC401]|uniref:SMP-30/gluconolactonase/LRE family protein n=1 Tax=unclassified Nonomuraea TaxID=2593643 RepID=UPI0010FE0B6B|nr:MULTISPECIES: SMP-30/gluconolactonase/LRE family protein [unclassified Nonomuraea]NBE92131.1 SMP-30/gluconolactonase/LRE family protein [Nonomuraea sp. K271]TLF85628.1 SMP-30/gluconolactonase/LRE family protein [Nonomuraea sp. KC401]